jgi:hypothetical protein
MLHGTQGSALRYLEWVESIGSNNKHCIIGHNIEQFDIPIIIRSLVRGVSKDIGKARIDRFTKAITHYIDTYPLFRDSKAMWDASSLHTYPKDTTIFQSFKLGDLYNHVFSERLPNAHTAVGDAKANLKLLLALDPTLYYAKSYMKEVNELVTKITQ